MTNPFIYLRGLKKADHTVFGVEKGQKIYKDPVYGRYLPFSSGQQVKRSIIDSLLSNLNESIAPVTFIHDFKGKELGEGEVLSICDPNYSDQLVGGWMSAQKGGEVRTVKRRSPLSISALHPLHPLLAGTSSENATFDRSDKPHLHQVIVRDEKGNKLSDEEIDNFLKGTDRSLFRKWIPENRRASGLFIYDIAIDLRTLFCVSTNQHEPEMTKEMIEKLKGDGWIESKNVFGDCLLCPKEKREEIIPALAHALINWRITSNQARTFSLMETLAVSISNNANKIAASIRAKLVEEETNKAKPIVEHLDGVDTFVTLPCAGYIVVKDESYDALDKAEQKLIDLMMAFDYENQV